MFEELERAGEPCLMAVLFPSFMMKQELKVFFLKFVDVYLSHIVSSVFIRCSKLSILSFCSTSESVEKVLTPHRLTRAYMERVKARMAIHRCTLSRLLIAYLRSSLFFYFLVPLLAVFQQDKDPQQFRFLFALIFHTHQSKN